MANETIEVEDLRLQYKPERVEFLLVGESAPAEGTFFYDKSLMTTYTRNAFQAALGLTFQDDAEFFEHMKRTGVYLEDLSQVPVDKMAPAEREAKLVEESRAFAQRVAEMNPALVVVVLKKIHPLVEKALAEVGCTAEVKVLPFPGNGHQTKYMTGLTQIIREQEGQKAQGW